MKDNRYSRQVLFPQIGAAGQEKLQKKQVLIVGAGALGSSSAEMLVRAGVGKVTIIDRDYVEFSNLQRQQLYTEEDATSRVPKAIAAEKRLKEINSSAAVTGVVAEATKELLEQYLIDADVLIDATDNFETRMLLNDLAVYHHIPWIYGACVGSSGMSFTIIPEETPCLNCLLQKLPVQGMTCDTVGIIAPAVQMVVTHQVTEALKILIEDRQALRGSFLHFDLWSNAYSSMKVSRAKNPACQTCGTERSYPYLKGENKTKTAVLCGRETVQIRPSHAKKLSLIKLGDSLKKNGYKVMVHPFLLSVELEQNRLVLFEDGRALVHDTKDVTYAKSLYDKLLG
ncbi:MULTISPECIES: ThiF family adenylyltransferase [Bacillaceae]|uniref:ThiF family adenylyltransferase n=1 Tax=Bacillaceae TaxID=186817 RepID=UPI001E5D9E13|nr:ThiF family adenylyltransferase [Bacillus sp. Au-Bac7]MCE4049747.1 ThiF family adenylyltransferase [Bacillus sp. Au-Bac7]